MEERIRYKYTPVKKGFILKNVKCPTCKSNHINWFKIAQDRSWNGKTVLLVECWSGDTQKDKPRHLYLIELDNLPIVEISKVKKKPKMKASRSFKKRRKTTSRRIKRG